MSERERRRQDIYRLRKQGKITDLEFGTLLVKESALWRELGKKRDEANAKKLLKIVVDSHLEEYQIFSRVGYTKTEIAERFAISPRVLANAVKVWEESGKLK